MAVPTVKDRVGLSGLRCRSVRWWMHRWLPSSAAAGLALDTASPTYPGGLPPHGATTYCVNAIDDPRTGRPTHLLRRPHHRVRGDCFGNAVAPCGRRRCELLDVRQQRQL